MGAVNSMIDMAGERQAAFKILCYGDDFTSDFSAQGQTSRPYGRTLEDTLNALGVKCKVSIHAIRGMTARQMAESMDAAKVDDARGHTVKGLSQLLANEGPHDLAIIMAGSWDMVSGAAKEQIVRNVAMLHSACHACRVPSICLAPTSPVKANQHEVNKALGDWVQKAHMVLAFIDTDICVPRTTQSYWDVDGVLLTPAGSNTLGNQLVAKVLPVLSHVGSDAATRAIPTWALQQQRAAESQRNLGAGVSNGDARLVTNGTRQAGIVDMRGAQGGNGAYASQQQTLDQQRGAERMSGGNERSSYQNMAGPQPLSVGAGGKGSNTDTVAHGPNLQGPGGASNAARASSQQLQGAAARGAATQVGQYYAEQRSASQRIPGATMQGQSQQRTTADPHQRIPDSTQKVLNQQGAVAAPTEQQRSASQRIPGATQKALDQQRALAAPVDQPRSASQRIPGATQKMWDQQRAVGAPVDQLRSASQRIPGATQRALDQQRAVGAPVDQPRSASQRIPGATQRALDQQRAAAHGGCRTLPPQGSPAPPPQARVAPAAPQVSATRGGLAGLAAALSFDEDGGLGLFSFTSLPWWPFSAEQQTQPKAPQRPAGALAHGGA